MGTKTGIGVGLGVGGSLSIAGIMLLLLCMKRRHRRDNRNYPRILEANETAPPDQRQWEKPELIGEDARMEMEAEESGPPELHGEAARTEMGATNLRHMIAAELHS